MSEAICSRCGHPNSEAANFCSSCGFDLSRHEAEVTTAHNLDLSAPDDVEVSGPAASGAELVVTRGVQPGARHPLDKHVVTIGRHPRSDIVLDDVTVSRRHAEVRFIEGVYTVVDVGSLNGTYLNRERVEEARMVSGDEVQIGKFKLVFLTADSA